VLETLFDIAILVNEIDTNILSPDASSGQNRSLVNKGADPPCKLRGRGRFQSYFVVSLITVSLP